MCTDQFRPPGFPELCATVGVRSVVNIKRDAQTTCDALIGAVAGMPARLLRSLTWDQGPELAAHAALTPAASIPVYVAHPHSPWERGTTENTSGLIRQHFPNGATITDDQACLSAVAAELHNRPRRIRIPSPRRSLHRASHQLICFHRLKLPWLAIIGAVPGRLEGRLRRLVRRSSRRPQ
jgi:hypothetical protein